MTALRKCVRAGLAALVLVSSAAQAEPGNSSSLDGTASAELVDPGRLYKLEDLRFGAFMRPATAGTLVITPAGIASGTGGVTAGMNIPQPTEGRGPASFQLDGAAYRGFIAQVPNRITISNGSATMQVRNVTSNTLLGLNLFNGAGDFTLRIGGTLQVNSNQAVGQYTGDFQITVLFL